MERGLTLMEQYGERDLCQVTGLLNMMQFMRRASVQLQDASAEPLTFIYFDIENFKSFNQRYGFHQGNRLLRYVADLLRETFEGNLVARFNDDHFAVATPRENPNDCIQFIHERIHVYDLGLPMEVKAGIYHPPEDVIDVALIMDRAKIACNSIKNTYDLTWAEFNPSMEEELNFRSHIIRSFQEAMIEGYIEVYYQPEIRAMTGEICGFESGDTARIAVLRRIVDLKEDPLLQEFRRLDYDEARQRELKSKMYDFTREIHESMHAALIAEAGTQGILQPFYLELLKGVHRIGLVLSDMQKSWQALIIEGTNKRLQKEFSSLAQAKEFLLQEELFMRTPHGEICERCYGAIVQHEGKSQMVPYAVAFADEMAKLQGEFSDLLERLVTLAEDESELAYVAYLGKLKQAFCERDASAVIGAWRDAEIAWMDIKTPLQIGHPLEYYEDAYTHAVALEWDVRLAGAYEFSAEEFKARVSESFECAYEKIGANNAVMHSLVLSNIAKTQLYVCAPLIYYGADLNGLFSAQVVPNDEFVSTNCGKKIFAFVNFVYESAKARPFMRLSGEIFEPHYLNFGREILFKKPQIWRRVYEISTIGHEFGHIFFIDADTEARMNRSGLFKLIEEYKATTGGLVSFFFHEEEEFCLPVLDELIQRERGQQGADGAGKSVDGFRLKVEATPQQEITLTMSGPWSSQCNYHVKLRSTFADNKTIDKSVTYENTATLVAAGTQVKTERAYLESFTGTASYQDGGKTKQSPGAEQTVASEDA